MSFPVSGVQLICFFGFFIVITGCVWAAESDKWWEECFGVEDGVPGALQKRAAESDKWWEECFGVEDGVPGALQKRADDLLDELIGIPITPPPTPLNPCASILPVATPMTRPSQLEAGAQEVDGVASTEHDKDMVFLGFSATLGSNMDDELHYAMSFVGAMGERVRFTVVPDVMGNVHMAMCDVRFPTNALGILRKVRYISGLGQELEVTIRQNQSSQLLQILYHIDHKEHNHFLEYDSVLQVLYYRSANCCHELGGAIARLVFSNIMPDQNTNFVMDGAISCWVRVVVGCQGVSVFSECDSPSIQNVLLDTIGLSMDSLPLQVTPIGKFFSGALPAVVNCAPPLVVCEHNSTVFAEYRPVLAIYNHCAREYSFCIMSDGAQKKTHVDFYVRQSLGVKKIFSVHLPYLEMGAVGFDIKKDSIVFVDCTQLQPKNIEMCVGSFGAVVLKENGSTTEYASGYALALSPAPTLCLMLTPSDGVQIFLDGLWQCSLGITFNAERESMVAKFYSNNGQVQRPFFRIPMPPSILCSAPCVLRFPESAFAKK